jgi:hypothetical protein
MTNLGYCRFQNTVQDLQDCYSHLFDQLHDDEEIARDDLIILCQQIIDDWKDDNNE